MPMAAKLSGKEVLKAEYLVEMVFLIVEMLDNEKIRQ